MLSERLLAHLTKYGDDLFHDSWSWARVSEARDQLIELDKAKYLRMSKVII